MQSLKTLEYISIYYKALLNEDSKMISNLSISKQLHKYLFQNFVISHSVVK